MQKVERVGYVVTHYIERTLVYRCKAHCFARALQNVENASYPIVQSLSVGALQEVVTKLIYQLLAYFRIPLWG